jgi:hypothetical protein
MIGSSFLVNPLRRVLAVSVASISLAIVGALGLAPSADAAHSTPAHHAKQQKLKHVVVMKDIYCC